MQQKILTSLSLICCIALVAGVQHCEAADRDIFLNDTETKDGHEWMGVWVAGRGEGEYIPNTDGVISNNSPGILAFAIYIFEHQTKGGKWIQARIWAYDTVNKADGKYGDWGELTHDKINNVIVPLEGKVQPDAANGNGRNKRQGTTLTCSLLPDAKIHITGLYRRKRGQADPERQILCRFLFKPLAMKEVDDEPGEDPCNIPPEETILEEEPLIEDPVDDPLTEETPLEPPYYEDPV